MQWIINKISEWDSLEWSVAALTAGAVLLLLLVLGVIAAKSGFLAFAFALAILLIVGGGFSLSFFH